ncbi:50S ribosomal protein L32e [uncultured archaeon]|nr:50S ribosomal protein L32e [uncultured archaeon]
MVSKRKHPKFRRPNYGRSSRSRIKIAWRRPRGIDNKQRLKLAYMGCSPSIGYGQPSEIKHMHPQGMHEALVCTPSELSGLKEVAVRIAAGVGRRKRQEIIRLAESMKLRVLNKAKKYPVKVEKPKSKDEKKKTEAKPAAAAPAAPKAETKA